MISAPAYVTPAGALKLHDREAFMEAVATQLPRNAQVTIQVHAPNPLRERWQNRHWWAHIVRPLSEFTGYPLKEMHNELKLRFLEPNVEIPEPGPEARTTTLLSPAQFQRLCQDVRTWAATYLHVVLETPE